MTGQWWAVIWGGSSPRVIDVDDEGMAARAT